MLHRHWSKLEQKINNPPPPKPKEYVINQSVIQAVNQSASQPATFLDPVCFILCVMIGWVLTTHPLVFVFGVVYFGGCHTMQVQRSRQSTDGC